MNKPIQKAFFAAILLLAAAILGGCANEQAEQALIGTWVYTNSTVVTWSNETITTTRTMVMGDECTLTERVVETSSLYGENGVVEGTGEYSVDGDELYTHCEVTLNTLNNWIGMTARCPYTCDGEVLTVMDGVAGPMKYYRQ